jgi:BCD family chlorophyll transporter-like MFS transporter
VWFGSGQQLAGLAIMPFAIVLLSGENPVQLWAGHIAAALAFLLAGAGAQTVQTAGLALATDLATEKNRPRVVALMYVMLLLGMVGGGTLCSALLADFSDKRLVQVVQGGVLAAAEHRAVWNRKRAADGGATASGAGLRPAWRASSSANMPPFPVDGGAGHDGLQHAGHRARALRRRDPGFERGRHQRAHRADGRRRAGRFCPGRALAGPRRRPHRVAAVGLLAGLPAFAAVIFAAPLKHPGSSAVALHSSASAAACSPWAC